MKKETTDALLLSAGSAGSAMGAVFATNLLGKAIKPKVEGAPSKNEKYAKAALHGIVALGSAYGGYALKGKDVGSQIGRVAAYTAAGSNALAAIVALIDSNETVKTKLVANKTFGKIISNGLALGCPGCTSYNPAALNRPRRKHTRLRMPDDVANYAAASNSYFGNAVAEGANFLYAS